MGQRTVKIVFNAMVKNESKIILRMLESVYKYIDYWVIQDNGSTDGTQQLINGFFKEKNIPGFLYYEPWQYPGYNRNHTLQRCLESPHGCEYVLRLDADEVLEVDDDFDWEELRKGDEIYVYSIQREVTVSRPWMWRADFDWEYTNSRRHEVLIRKSRQPHTRHFLSNKLRQIMLPGGNTWENPFKYYIDSIELEQQVIKYEQKDPSDLDYDTDAYYVWYLAKSYVDFLEDCKNGKTKTFFGKDHEVEMARRGIFYYKKYLDLKLQVNLKETLSHYNSIEHLNMLGCINEMAYIALLYVGVLNLRYVDVDEGIYFLNKTYEFDHLRNEGIFHLINHYICTNNIKMAYKYSSIAVKNLYPSKVRDFFLERVCYPDTSYYLYDTHSLISHELGYNEEAKTTCKKLIDNIQLVPESERNRIENNYRVFCESVN